MAVLAVVAGATGRIAARNAARSPRRVSSAAAGLMIGIAVVLSRGMAGQFSEKHHSAVEAIHYYWHFVDIVWVVLFTVIYVLR